MKKKLFVIITSIVIIAILICSVIMVINKIRFDEYCNKETLYERLNFDIPKDAQIEELYSNINESSMKGDASECLAIKFKIKDEEFDNFIQIIEEADYLYWDWFDGTDDAIPHTERTLDNWDLDYSKLESVYGYDFARVIDKWTIQGPVTLTLRCHIYLYITESQDGVREIYIYYAG